MMSESNQNTGIVHEAMDALTEDPKIPPDERVQESTFLLAAVSYFVILALGALILSGILWLYRTPDTDEPAQAVPGIMLIMTNWTTPFSR